MPKYILIAGVIFYMVTSFQLVSAQPVFKINDFSAAEDDLQLVGSAQIDQGRLHLTRANPDEIGACWYQVRKIDLVKGFTTEFTFEILHNDPIFDGGDGFAFVIQNQGVDKVGFNKDGVGYKGIPYALAMEFDTRDDNEGSRNHVCLSFYEKKKNGYNRHATVHEIPELNDGQAHFARIEYKDNFLTFYLDSYLFPILSVRLDIADIIGAEDGSAWLGFTSSTSNSYSQHDLIRWLVEEVVPPPAEIEEEKIQVDNKRTLAVKNRKITVKVWDNNRIDGDIISLKAGNNWILVDHVLEKQPKSLDLTLTGFESRLILFANNVGDIPPNTASISIDDGDEVHVIELEAGLDYSEAIIIQYKGDNE